MVPYNIKSTTAVRIANGNIEITRTLSIDHSLLNKGLTVDWVNQIGILFNGKSKCLCYA